LWSLALARLLLSRRNLAEIKPFRRIAKVCAWLGSALDFRFLELVGLDGERGRIGERDEILEYKWIESEKEYQDIGTDRAAHPARAAPIFLLQSPPLGRIIARLFVMGGTIAQSSVGCQVSLLGRQPPVTPAVKLHSRNSRRPQPTPTFP
jgi:hypothetical protein